MLSDVTEILVLRFWKMEVVFGALTETENLVLSST